MRSFYEKVPDRAHTQEELMKALADHALVRNGLDFELREKWLISANADPVRHKHKLDAKGFARGLDSFQLYAGASMQAVALLGFVKVNAGEQYGVNIVQQSRLREVTSLYDHIEKQLLHEETYHSRILAGATQQFGLPPPRDSYKPPLPLKLLIAVIARVPNLLFHPIVLATEIGGVKAFQWMLRRVKSLFPDEPALRETLEARLIEILIDEVGHIAFHRLCAGNSIVPLAKALSQPVLKNTTGALQEMQAIGMSTHEVNALADLDFADLPDEVKRRAFFA